MQWRLINRWCDIMFEKLFGANQPKCIQLPHLFSVHLPHSLLNASAGVHNWHHSKLYVGHFFLNSLSMIDFYNSTHVNADCYLLVCFTFFFLIKDLYARQNVYTCPQCNLTYILIFFQSSCYFTLVKIYVEIKLFKKVLTKQMTACLQLLWNLRGKCKQKCFFQVAKKKNNCW